MNKLNWQPIYILRNTHNDYDIICSTKELAEEQLKIELAAYKGSCGWDNEDDWDIVISRMKIA